jgi:hypothetical protein
MSSSTATVRVPEGRTKWRRFAIVTGPVIALAGVLVFLAATGAMAVSFQISGIPFKLNASQMTGTGFVQYATVDQVTNANSGAFLPADAAQSAGGNTFDAATVTRLASAKIYDLNQTVCAPIPGMGFLPKNKLLVTLKAGGGGAPAEASGLLVDAPLMTAGDATFTNIVIGQDLGNALGGASNGSFAQSADAVTINDLQQLAISTTAGTFKLNGLNLAATFVSSCP